MCYAVQAHTILALQSQKALTGQSLQPPDSPENRSVQPRLYCIFKILLLGFAKMGKEFQVLSCLYHVKSSCSVQWQSGTTQKQIFSYIFCIWFVQISYWHTPMEVFHSNRLMSSYGVTALIQQTSSFLSDILMHLLISYFLFSLGHIRVYLIIY